MLPGLDEDHVVEILLGAALRDAREGFASARFFVALAGTPLDAPGWQLLCEGLATAGDTGPDDLAAQFGADNGEAGTTDVGELLLEHEHQVEDVERLAADEGLVMAVTSKGELSGSTYGSYGAQVPELPLGPWSRISRPGSTVGWMCAVRVDGTPLCFGDPELDGHGLDATPDFVAADVCVVEFYGACALDIDGRPICWGEDIDFSPPSGPFAKLSCGDATWCGRTPEGEATCWGDCDSGICDLPP